LPDPASTPFDRGVLLFPLLHLVEYIKQGEPYSKIKKVISINLVYFNLGQGEDYVYHGKTEFIGLNKKDVLKLDSYQQELYKTEKISDIYPDYYILKINQFNDIARNTIDEWIYFFKNERIEDNFTARGKGAVEIWPGMGYNRG